MFEKSVGHRSSMPIIIDRHELPSGVTPGGVALPCIHRSAASAKHMSALNVIVEFI